MLNADERAFYYVDGIPTKGLWIDLDSTTDEDDIKETLAEAGFIPRDEDDEPDYDGDLLVADAEGDIAPHFLSRYGGLDLKTVTEILDFLEYGSGKHTTSEAVGAYLGHFGTGGWSESNFEDVYYGEAESEKEFAEQFADETGMLSEVPEDLKSYFDYAAYARDLFINDFTFVDGYVFWNN